MNRKVMYDLFFRSVSETIEELVNDPKHLGAKAGVIGILHTWGQNLMDHPHIHCIVTGAGYPLMGTAGIMPQRLLHSRTGHVGIVQRQVP